MYATRDERLMSMLYESQHTAGWQQMTATEEGTGSCRHANRRRVWDHGNVVVRVLTLAYAMSRAVPWASSASVSTQRSHQNITNYQKQRRTNNTITNVTAVPRKGQSRSVLAPHRRQPQHQNAAVSVVAINAAAHARLPYRCSAGSAFRTAAVMHER